MDSRATRILAAVVGALVLLAVVAAVVASTRQPAEQPEGSPERAVQDYVRAIYDGDTDVALDLLSPDTGCEVTDLDEGYVDRDVRVVLGEAKVDGGGSGIDAPDGSTARVTIDLVNGDDGPIQVDEWREEQILHLERIDGTWRLTGVPWPAYRCDGSEQGSRR